MTRCRRCWTMSSEAVDRRGERGGWRAEWGQGGGAGQGGGVHSEQLKKGKGRWEEKKGGGRGGPNRDMCVSLLKCVWRPLFTSFC